MEKISASDDDTAERLTPAFNAGAEISPERLAEIKKHMTEAIIGQEGVTEEILRRAMRPSMGSLILTSPAGVGKTAMAKVLAKRMASDTWLQPRDAVRLGIVDEPHAMEQDARAAAVEGLRRTRIGDMAAQACHDGLTESMTPMKPLSLKRGFAYLM